MGKENMKKLYIFIVLASLLLLSACGNSRDLSTPSSRLVGHWRSINTVVKGEYYFGEINEETGKGSFAEYSAKNGSLAKGTYKIVHETPEGEAITILPTLFGYEDSDIPSSLLEMDLEVQEDGLKAKIMDFYIEYVNAKPEY